MPGQKVSEQVGVSSAESQPCPGRLQLCLRRGDSQRLRGGGKAQASDTAHPAMGRALLCSKGTRLAECIVSEEDWACGLNLSHLP